MGGECLLLGKPLLTPRYHHRRHGAGAAAAAARRRRANAGVWRVKSLFKAGGGGEQSGKQRRDEELLKKVARAEEERVAQEEVIGHKILHQAELERVQLNSWKNFHGKVLGELRGTPVDPVPGASIAYSDLWDLLEKGRVNYVEYANYGQHMAVILPHYVKDGKPAENSKQVLPVYQRHPVTKMPADAMGDVWKKLYPQLKSIRVIQTNTIPQQLRTQLKIMTVWGMRLVLATAIYLLCEKLFGHFLRWRDPDDRGWKTTRNLKLGDYLLGSYGESRARFISAEESTGVTFDDFAGQEHIKEELKRIVQRLKESRQDPTLYVPKGVLLHGPPGTGKTLLARAIAGEAGLPFFSASGSEFVEMYAGVAASRVKDLFSRARNFAPSIIFIDEIDAIGAKRGGSDYGGGGAEREQGLIQMLTELDGFRSGLNTSKVLVIGATNRLDMLDRALLRKGRFDKIVPVGIPSDEGRLAILQVHAKNKAFKSEEEKNSLLRSIIGSTRGFSGAELANVLNEAVILSIRHDKEFIERPELEEAIARQKGTFTTGQEDLLDVTGEARTRLAYREAAAAVLQCYFPNRSAQFTRTNILQMDSVLNIEYDAPQQRFYARKQDYIENIVRTCAPRVVEELIFGKENISWFSGTSYTQATSYIDYLLLKTGMTALGKVHFRGKRDILPHLVPKILALRQEYMDYAIERCTSVLLEHRCALETITDTLLEKNVVEADEIREIFRQCPRVRQPEVLPVDEYETIMEHGRWGIHGISLPGRVTFRPGNVGTATFGAPKPIEVQFLPDEVWAEVDKRINANLRNMEKLLETPEGREVLRSEMMLHYKYAHLTESEVFPNV